MTDPTPATVAVPVELLRALVEDEPRISNLRAAKALLPNPTTRLVAVDLDGAPTDSTGGWVSKQYLATQPDLLALLDEVVDATDEVWSLGGDSRLPTLTADLKARIRAALGVTE